MAEIRYQIAATGPVLALRAQARRIREGLHARTNAGDRIVLDFAGVEAITNAFAHELLADIPDRKVVIRNENEHVREALTTALTRRNQPPHREETKVMPTRFRKLPVEVEAVQWTGDNLDEMRAFTGPNFDPIHPEDRGDDPDATGQVYDRLHSTWVRVYTGQWVIRGAKGEFYPIAEDVLAETYEPVATTAEGGHEGAEPPSTFATGGIVHLPVIGEDSSPAHPAPRVIRETGGGGA